MDRTIYFEDLFVGMAIRSIEVEMTQDEMVAFSRANDPQFFHVDAEAAQGSLFGGLVASGWQTAALTLQLLLTGSGMTFAGGVVGADAHIAWKAPVRPGDRLHVEGEITKTIVTRSRPDRGFAGFKAATLNQNGVIVQTIEATMLVFRKSASTLAPA
jgi:acyl dehydratase